MESAAERKTFRENSAQPSRTRARIRAVVVECIKMREVRIRASVVSEIGTLMLCKTSGPTSVIVLDHQENEIRTSPEASEKELAPCCTMLRHGKFSHSLVYVNYILSGDVNTDTAIFFPLFFSFPPFFQHRL